MSNYLGRLLCRYGWHDSHASVTWVYGVQEIRCSRCGILREWVTW